MHYVATIKSGTVVDQCLLNRQFWKMIPQPIGGKEPTTEEFIHVPDLYRSLHRERLSLSMQLARNGEVSLFNI
jgi:hypothetical protein